MRGALRALMLALAGGLAGAWLERGRARPAAAAAPPSPPPEPDPDPDPDAHPDPGPDPHPDADPDPGPDLGQVDQADEAALLRARLEMIAQEQGRFRHDMRGALSPAMLSADRLVTHADPAVQRAGDRILRSLERAAALLDAQRNDTLPPEAPPSDPTPPS
jgi:hypothetical protein